MKVINSEPDLFSLLTNISANESPSSTPRSICLHTDERFVGFQKNDDPNITEYMETKVEKIGWEKYQYQCKKFGMPAMQIIKKCLDGEPNLDLAYYIPKSIGTVYAFEILNEQPKINITRIDLRNCPMTETGCISLNEFLRRRSPLVYLNLKNNKIGYKGVEILERGLYVNQGIKYLNLSGCNLGDQGATILARALNGNEVCEHLDISHNNLYFGCGDALKLILGKTHIKVLNLGWNELYMDKCVEKIFQGLKVSKRIQQLNFSWNGLSGSDWIKSFKQALTKNETLEILNMENNRLASVADQIMSGVSKSVSLKELYMGANPWKEQDLLNILKVYQKPSNLSILSLGVHTYLTVDCALLTKNAMKSNPDLKIIFKGQIKDRPLEEVNFKAILVDRLKALAQKPKKKKLRKDMGHFFLKLKAQNVKYDDPENFVKTLTEFGAKLDAPLIQQFADEFTKDVVIKKKKTKKIGLIEISKYYLARHPTEPPVIVEKKAKPAKKREKDGGKKKDKKK